MAEQLQFSNTPISLLSTGLLAGGYTGTLTVDYVTNTVTGSIITSPALGSTLPLLNFSQFKLTYDPTSNTYTLTSIGDGLVGALTNFTLTYQGQAPTAVNSSVAALGALPLFGATGTPITSVFVCFVEGTLIRTPDGDVPIETLRVGDLVLNAAGAPHPVKWLGHRRVDCWRHPDPRAARPVRIAANAFGDGAPQRDLFVSPGHAICVGFAGDVLIPASELINGATIAQVDVETVTYWHLELEQHEIIISNGLPTESYIDVGNRQFFRTGSGDIDADRSPASISDYCRPFAADGPVVDVVRDYLLTRAFGLGWALQERADMALRVEVDGEILEPVVDGLAARFLIPGPKEVWLLSKTSVPAMTRDTRSLGAYIRRLEIRDGLSAPREIALDDPRLSAGFYAPEETDGIIYRWTSAQACLPESLWAGLKGPFFLKIELAGTGLPTWIEPADRASDLPPQIRPRIAEAA